MSRHLNVKWVMVAARWFVALPIVIVLVALQLTPAQADAGPTGRTVKAVYMSNEHGVYGGQMRAQGDGTWVSLGLDGKVLDRLRETARDDWSVYLTVEQREIAVQIDLHRMLVLAGRPGEKQMDTFAHISGAESDPPTGRTVTLVDYSSFDSTAFGRLYSEGGGKWVEVDARDQPRFHFIEKARDDWSVYLLDPSRNLELQVDLFKDLISWNLVGQPRQPLYTIIKEQ